MFGQELAFGASLRITLAGNFFGQTFVSFLGGDASRFWEMRQQGIGLRDAGSAVLLDRFLGLVGAHLLIVGLLPWTLRAIDAATMRGGLVLVAVAGLRPSPRSARPASCAARPGGCPLACANMRYSGSRSTWRRWRGSRSPTSALPRWPC